ncbi:unnamed protein product [Discula destructiva]
MQSYRPVGPHLGTNLKLRFEAFQEICNGLTSTPQDGTFHVFPCFPFEVQELIWNFAARTLHLNEGHVHFLTEEINEPPQDVLEGGQCAPTSATRETLITTSLNPDLASSVAGSDISLWTACKTSRAVMNRRFMTNEWWRASAWFGEHSPRGNILPPNSIMGQWKSVRFADQELFLRPRKDLLVFQGNGNAATPRSNAGQPSFRLEDLAPPARFFPEAVLHNHTIVHEDFAHIAFSVGADLQTALAGMPYTVYNDSSYEYVYAWSHKLISMRNLRPHNSWPQLWFTDSTLQTPKAWNTSPSFPEGRQVFRGDGFSLVEVQLGDYLDVPPKRLHTVLPCIADFDQPISRNTRFKVLSELVKGLMAGENASVIRAAAREFAPFQLAFALKQNFEQRRPPASDTDIDRYAQMWNMFKEIKVLAYDPPLERRRDASPSSADLIGSFLKDVNNRGYKLGPPY